MYHRLKLAACFKIIIQKAHLEAYSSNIYRNSGFAQSYSTLKYRGDNVIDVSAVISEPDRPAEQANSSKLDPILDWLETSSPVLGGKDFRLLAYESEIKTIAIKFSPGRALGKVTHLLRTQRKGGNQFIPDSLQEFVSLPVIYYCLLNGLKNGLKPMCLSIFKEMALLGVIPNNKRLVRQVLREFTNSEKDYLTPQDLWYKLSKKRFTGLPLSHAELMLLGLAKESHVSPLVRLDMVRGVLKDLPYAAPAPTVQTFKAIYRALSFITKSSSAVAQLSPSEVSHLESWLAQAVSEKNTSLSVYRMSFFRNLGQFQKVKQIYTTSSNLPSAAANLMIEALARQATAAHNPEILSAETHAKAGMYFAECMQFFAELLEANKAGLQSFSISLRLATVFQNKDKAKWILDELQARPDIVPDEKLMSLMIRHHSSLGELDSMMLLYNSLQEKGIAPSNATLISVIFGLCKALKNREADAFFHDEYLSRCPTPEQSVLTHLLFAHARALDMSYFHPLYRFAVNQRLASAPVFEKTMVLSIHFGDISILRSALCDTFASGLTPSPEAIVLTLDFLIDNWSDRAFPPTPTALANLASNLLCDIKCSPTELLAFRRSFNRAVFQAAQIRLTPM
ncbi:hypothetical protein DSO57_1001353 [Entomophthora muscae]|uniref:Uncharacterized protein n=1 Tax=Entomophthora muscae TaxID=34485 RepID=A0ACC2SYD2_9FUNG|nr:hypothetical protein DSO57_1001353 [Entomophthora muscae]